MKCFYWNLRGLSNYPTKLALKKLLVKFKPELCFTSEPMMPINNLSPRWLHNLGVKVCAVNNRGSLLPNLWCLYSSQLSPTIINIDDQQFSIQVDLEGKSFGVTTLYASNCYIKRRQLWSAISHIQNHHKMPSSCIGDFNTILGSHEHKGIHEPARLHMTEFQQWSDLNNLVHLHTRGVSFTWSNGRRGRNNTQKRLDRVLVNQDWINVCQSSSVSTLTKLRSDHYSLLFEFQTQSSQFTSSFKFMKMWISHPDCTML